MKFADGEAVTSWDALTLRDTFTDPLGSLDFTVTPMRERVAYYRTRLAKGQRVTVSINDTPQGSFLVDTLQTSIGREGVTYKVNCKSLLVTAYQGAVNPDLSFHSQTDVPVKDVVLQAMAPYGFTTVVADTTASVRAISGRPVDGRKAAIVVEALKHQDCQAQEGETAYQFCARIFTRLGVVLRVNHEGVLLLCAPDYEQRPLYNAHQTFATAMTTSDRFLDGIEITDTNDNQFSECVVRGVRGDKKGQTQTSRPAARLIGTAAAAVRPPTAPFAAIAATALTDGRHTYRSAALPAGGSAAPYKPLCMMDKHARDADRCKSVGKLALGIRSKDGFTVSGEVDGFMSRTGALWQVDTMAGVVIEAYGLDETMWLAERTFMQSRGEGQTTRLRFVPSGSLVLGDVPN